MSLRPLALRAQTIRQIHTTISRHASESSLPPPLAPPPSEKPKSRAEELGFSPIKRERKLDPLTIPIAPSSWMNTNEFGSATQGNQDGRRQDRQFDRPRRDSTSSPRDGNAISADNGRTRFPIPRAFNQSNNTNGATAGTGGAGNQRRGDGINRRDGQNRDQNRNRSQNQNQNQDRSQNYKSNAAMGAGGAGSGNNFTSRLPSSSRGLPSTSGRHRNLPNIEGLDGTLEGGAQPSFGAGAGAGARGKGGRAGRSGSVSAQGQGQGRRGGSGGRDTGGAKRDRGQSTVGGVAAFRPKGAGALPDLGKGVTIKKVEDHSPEGLFGTKTLLFATAQAARNPENSFWAAGMSPAEARKADVYRIAGSTKHLLPSPSLAPFPVNQQGVKPAVRARNSAMWSLALNKSVAARKRVPAEEVVRGYLG